MRKQPLLLATCVFLTGCEDIGFVEKAKYDASQAQLKQAQEDLKKAQQQVSDCQAHKYQIYREGWRTWRLDSVTGKTCILLTTEQDWKNPKTQESSCQCEDAINDGKFSFELLRAMGCYGKVNK